MYQILLYYKYVDIEKPDNFREAQRELCKKLDLKGRIIVATEGINGTLEGTIENTQKYISEMRKDSRFTDMNFKISVGTGDSFPKLRVRTRPEIVSLHLGEEDIDPRITTGKYISAEELHEWIYGHRECGKDDHSEDSKSSLGVQAREFYIIDMRNDFEYSVGYFENSIFAGMENFRNLKECLPKISHLRNKTIVTVCTGGVRCEKASGFLLTQGFQDVYQLKNGIVTYMERYPNMDFSGKLYVFDKRLVMGFNTERNDHKIVGKCKVCGKESERFINCLNDDCSRHFICCEDCSTHNGRRYCPIACRENY